MTSLTQQEFNIGSGRGFTNDDHDHAVVCVILHGGMAGRGRQQMQILLKSCFYFGIVIPLCLIINVCIYCQREHNFYNTVHSVVIYQMIRPFFVIIRYIL